MCKHAFLSCKISPFFLVPHLASTSPWYVLIEAWKVWKEGGAVDIISAYSKNVTKRLHFVIKHFYRRNIQFNFYNPVIKHLKVLEDKMAKLKMKRISWLCWPISLNGNHRCKNSIVSSYMTLQDILNRFRTIFKTLGHDHLLQYKKWYIKNHR